MRVFVAGATGVLGRRLVAELADDHDVVGLVRDEEGAGTVADAGGRPRRGDVLDRGSVVDAAEGADAVVHAATAIPRKMRATDDDWAYNDRVRVEGARNLAAAAAEADADRFLQQSVTWLARQPDGSAFDETAEPHPDRATRSAWDAERVARAAASEHGFDLAVLRCGWFYSQDSWHTRLLGERLLDRRLPVLGGGLLGRRDAAIAALHVDDAARAFAAAVAGDATGLWHVVDDEPVTGAAFLGTLAALLDAPPPRRVPGWLARPLVGANTVRFFTNPAPTSNERFRAAFGWTPALATYREGLRRVVDRWRERGTLVETDEGVAWREAAATTEPAASAVDRNPGADGDDRAHEEGRAR